MKTGNRSNALLVELMIVIMFFMLTTSVLLEVFAKARKMSARAELLTNSLVIAQNTADRLYAADDPEKTLTEMNFSKDGDRWIYPLDNAVIEAVITEEPAESGAFRRQEVRVMSEDEQLYILPCSRWEVRP